MSPVLGAAHAARFKVITNPDNRTRAFVISASYAHHITSDTQGTLVNSWQYNSHEQVSQSTWGNASSPSVSNIIPVAFQGLDNLVVGSPVCTVTDPLGFKTQFTLDSKGRLIKQFNTDGSFATWTRDAAGRVLTYNDPHEPPHDLAPRRPRLCDQHRPSDRLGSVFL